MFPEVDRSADCRCRGHADQMKPAEAAPMIPLTCTLPMIPLTVTITLFWTPHGLAHYLKESPCLSNSIRKRCVSLPGRFFVLYLSWFGFWKKKALSLSLFVSFIFLKNRYLYFSPIKLLYVSIILGTLNTLIFQNSIISRPSCSPAVWRLFRGVPWCKGSATLIRICSARDSDGVAYDFF